MSIDELVDESLKDVSNLYLDTAPVIYFIESHPKYDIFVSKIFQRVADGKVNAITSAITLCEVLVQPIAQNNQTLEQEYHDLLLNSAGFQTLPIDGESASLAARLRAQYNLRTPDALQIATALKHGCEALLTNDTKMKRITQLRVLILDELIA